MAVGSRRISIVVLLVASLVAAACSSGTVPGGAQSAIPTTGVRLDRVFVVVLENTSAADALGNHGFAQLARSGSLLRQYFGVAHNSLPNYLAMTSGVQPTSTTRADCPTFDCQVTARNLTQQLDQAHVTWKGYFGGTFQPCSTPQPGDEDTLVNGYVMHHNPFAYYPSVGAGPNGGNTYCQDHMRPLAELGADAGSGSMPRFALVSTDSCEDGHDVPCQDGRPGGMATAVPWLQRTVTAITSSKSWTRRSLLVVTFDEASTADTGGCCGGPSPGGGRVATVLLSGLVTPGTTSDRSYNHYSLLRTIEDGFGIGEHLGAAADPKVQPIADVFGSQ